MIDAGRSSEVGRSAPPELVLDYLDLLSEEGVTEDQLKKALARVVLASGVLERKVHVEYDQAAGALSYVLPPPLCPNSPSRWSAS
jgi:hypothetical protein